MGKRVILLLAGAAVLVLALAAPALARRAADPYATPVSYGWLLQLRSAKWNRDMTYKGFHNFANHKGVGVTITDPGKDPLSTADDTIGSGLPLYRLVGRIDDKDPSTFNRRRATSAPGYIVQIEGLDGFTAQYTSAEVASLGKTLVVCDRIAGQPLNLGSLSAAIVNGVAVGSWKPTWPLKVLSSDPTITGKRKVAGVARISILPAPTTAAAPF
jgi:hypothetical protein